MLMFSYLKRKTIIAIIKKREICVYLFVSPIEKSIYFSLGCLFKNNIINANSTEDARYCRSGH